MPVTKRKGKEKSFTTQTVRLPKELERLIKHRMADTYESFQAFIMRLIEQELASNITVIDPIWTESVRAAAWLCEHADMETTELKPIKAHLEAALREYRKRKPKDRKETAGTQYHGVKTGT